jgi:glutamate racemase
MPKLNAHAGIGIIDSGLGGITVAREVFKQLPQETVYYLGDAKRCPYGPRTKAEIISFARELVQMLNLMPLKAVLVACNTITAIALEMIKKSLTVPVFGVVNPGIRVVGQQLDISRVGVLGTKATIASNVYAKRITQLRNGLKVFSLACDSFVPLVESGAHRTQRALDVVGEQLQSFLDLKLNAVVLGCTHYPLLSNAIRVTLGKDVLLINSAEEIVRELKSFLKQLNLKNTNHKPRHYFFTTGDLQLFQSIAEEWLSCSLTVYEAALIKDLFPVKKSVAGGYLGGMLRATGVVKG